MGHINNSHSIILISFIIPMYDVDAYDVNRCLNSIYREFPDSSTFEIICIDDASTSDKTISNILEYKHTHHNKTSNLRYFRNLKNLRQGGARNYGVREAKGRWIFYLDVDDWLHQDCGELILKELQYSSNIDIIMFDNAIANENKVITQSFTYKGMNNNNIMNGEQFLTTQKISWAPWNYAYKRDFLLNNDIKFVENVQFEDTDYVINAICKCRTIKFIPHSVIVYQSHSGSSSTIGNNPRKIKEIMYLSFRISEIARREYMNGNNSLADAVLKHHIILYKSNLTRYLWRLSFLQIKQLIKEYPPYDKLFILKLIKRYPNISAAFIYATSPIFKVAKSIFNLNFKCNENKKHNEL